MSGRVSRRQMLAIAGGAGVASLVAACSTARSAPAATQTPTPEISTNAPSTQSSAPMVSGVMLCRAAWGARPALPGGRPQTVTRMTLHHSAVALPDNRGIIARLQQHQRYHQDDKGWVDIAYHAAVDRDGNIYQLRDYNIAGDTAGMKNDAGTICASSRRRMRGRPSTAPYSPRDSTS